MGHIATMAIYFETLEEKRKFMRDTKGRVAEAASGGKPDPIQVAPIDVVEVHSAGLYNR